MFSEFLNSFKEAYWQKVALIIISLIAAYGFYPFVFNLKAEYLNTDLLIFFLVLSFIVFIAYIRNNPHLSLPWKQVFNNKIAMGSAVVLCFFILVGLLDSIHFRTEQNLNPANNVKSYSPNLYSLLDVSLSYISDKTEKTYSAPLSVYSYAKENFTNENGVKYRAYPRLKYGGAHIKDNDVGKNHLKDILYKSFVGVFIGLALTFILFILAFALINIKTKQPIRIIVRQIFYGETELPWLVMLVATGLIIVMSAWFLYMSHYYHVMGTDKVGQDVLYLTLKSIRTGLVIGTLTTLIMLPFAIILGVLAGFYRGIVDDIIQYIYTTLSSIPSILLIVAVMLAINVYIENHAELFETAIERADIKLLALCAVLGITSWTGLCRLLRGEVFKLRELEYIQAAKSLGVSNLKIIINHIVPNVMHIVLIVVVLDFSGLVLAEAILAYIGVGVDPSTISWGNMINSARLELAREPAVWWSLISAFSFMFALVLAANLFSDAIRDAFDPRMQGVK